MALVVEDGTGLANAESYVSVADADTYLTSVGEPGGVAWTGATVPNKEVALRQATQYLDITYREEWRGRRKIETQALAWPRTGAIDDDEFAIDDDSIPVNLERATAEAAWRFITNSGVLLPDFAGTDLIKRRRSKVGSLEDETEFLVGTSPGTQQTFPTIDLLIASLVTGSAQGATERG